MNAKFTGAKPISTSNPFGTAQLLPSSAGNDDLFSALVARLRGVVQRRSMRTKARA